MKQSAAEECELRNEDKSSQEVSLKSTVVGIKRL